MPRSKRKAPKAKSLTTNINSNKQTKKANLQIAINFDTTGSMYPCLLQVKQKVKAIVSKIQANYSGNVLFKISANGDYCDQYATYLFKAMSSFSNADDCKVFVENTGNTMGGDAPEA